MRHIQISGSKIYFGVIEMVRRKKSPEIFCPEKWSPGKESLEKWSLGKKVPGKMLLGKYPPKIILQKRVLGNLDDFFIFIHWFHFTHKKMFDVHLTILHVPNCRTLKESRKVFCRVLGSYKLITSQHSMHTHHDVRHSPHYFELIYNL